MQLESFNDIKDGHHVVKKFSTQLLKWVGNKQKFAHEIAGFFPDNYNTYYEPFLGSGAVLATLAPKKAIASDKYGAIIDIFKCLHDDPEKLVSWYSERWNKANGERKKEGYEEIKASYNKSPNGADLLFLCRSCYGGVVRFRKSDGYMSTPCGVHNPIKPESFEKRVKIWAERTKNTEFVHSEYEQMMLQANEGDLIYCDPPYVHSQGILYGGQDFSLEHLFAVIAECKSKGVYVALSIDGTKKSGNMQCGLPIPDGLFEREIFVNCGRSMLRRFQMEGKTLENELVSDRLLLTY
ncbi:DNA adenine methylase [Bathymodiolus japonicus methanotrophic gill symbiont]|uniref:DNA adenine methylase n=1 Tax=Bathymodiolus japonicus methanotrophic gill symbiont TaxID=113269 RepID=UPI001B3ED2E6|nr:Dam family site-specific DNA-(adenine-N6)-methyltransferase [Bathymodiolus japonicus methanotrophic gill symbiont]GFO73597.1 DNA adenine methylase [Bathymodiolus japonicus methanotrophic gill symbiont]